MTAELTGLVGTWQKRGYRRDAALSALTSFLVLDMIRRGGHDAAIDQLDSLAHAIAGATGQILLPAIEDDEDEDATDEH